MAAQVSTHKIESMELIGVAGFGLIGIALIALAPPKQPGGSRAA
jgi:hypothetical protein